MLSGGDFQAREDSAEGLERSSELSERGVNSRYFVRAGVRAEARRVWICGWLDIQTTESQVPV